MASGYARSVPAHYIEPGRGNRAQAEASKLINSQITQCATLQDLVHTVVVNFGRMNAVNFCTAYHRIARHIQDERVPPEAWPPAQQQELGSLLTELNRALMGCLHEVQAHNLGLTMWSISKTHRLPQEQWEQLWAALQVEVEARLATVDKTTYMRDKRYNFGPQSLSNIIYSSAVMGLRPDYDLLHALSRAVIWQAEELKPQGLANILWGLGKLGVKLTHEVRQMVDAVCAEMTAQLTHSRHKGSFAPQNISNSLHGIVNIGITPTPELLSALCGCAGGMLRQFGPQELTNLVWSLSQMHRHGVPFTPDIDALLARIPDELSLLFGDRAWRARVKPQTISNLCLAYAHLGRKPQLLMSLLLKEALPLLPHFKPQELSNLLWAMAAMDFWPGPGVVDAITKAAGAAAERMKPQELANCCWAWATMRFFPGAALLDSLLAVAECQLDRFKSQELGMLAWAMARLAYMPAAALVRAALPLVAQWRSPAVQDCGNLLWAFTVLGILTPEVLALLGGQLLALPREQFTQEAYIQLYQAKMTLSQQVYDIAQYIPPELLARGEVEWRQQAGMLKISVTHRDVASVMSALGIDHELERRIEDGLMSVDIALKNELVAVEVDGSAHFAQNEPFVPLGRTLWRWRLLASRGWRVVSVPYFRWGLLRTLDAKKQYLYRLLQCQSVWECYSLDPHQPDAPVTPPANLAHLSPEEVFQYAAQGIPFSSLVRSPSTPAASPTTPLLSGLGPSLGRTSSGPSSGFVPGLGLQPSSGSGSGLGVSSAALPAPPVLPLPLPLTTAAAGQTSSAADRNGGSNGYSSLPDSLYGGDSPRSSGSRLGAGAGVGLNVGARPFVLGGGSAGASPFVHGAVAASASRASSPAPQQSLRASGLTASAQAFVPGMLPAASRTHSGAPSVALARGSSVPSAAASISAGASLASSVANSPAVPSFGSAFSSAPASAQQSPQPPAMLHLLGLPAALQQPAAPRLRSPRLSPAAASTPNGDAAPSGAAPVALPGLSDDSDDDIGDLRSYFGSVIGISQPGEQQPQGPLSVEDVRRKLALLPADKVVADVAPAWLAGWEAAQVSELLAQLDSPTTAARAVQLFDWLRNQPLDSPHAHLCTPAVYATMIGLYGRWRKPKQAVRLFAEVKERGEDAPEVHSALVEAFCRSGQYDVALDAYRNMQAQQLPPSPAALRAVLDVLTQRGSWEEVDAVLAGCLELGVEADAELFHSVIERACACGESAAAQSVVDRMAAAGVSPTPRTFTSLLAALRQQHAPHEVAQDALELAARADAADAAAAAAGAPAGQAMRALHEACRANGWSDVSLQLLAAAEEARSVDAGLIDSVLAVCAAAGAADEARQTFARLACHGLQPSPNAYLHLVAALCGAGRWAEGVQAYDAMLAAGLQPCAELASLAIDALWCTGLGWAQARALRFFDQAISAGWLLPAQPTLSRGLLKVDLGAGHLGTGLLLMRHWLLGLRSAIGNSGAECVLDAAKRVCVVSGMAFSGGSADGQAASALAASLKDALGSSLVQHQAPFRLTHEAGRAHRLESSAFMLKKWLFTEAFDQWNSAFCGAAALADSVGDDVGSGGASLQAQVLAEARLEEQISQTYAIIRDYEAGHCLNAAGLRLTRYPERRHGLVAAAQQLVLGIGLGGARLWHAAVMLLDRAAAAGYQPCSDALAAAACVALAAAKEGLPLSVASLAALLDFGEAGLATAGAEAEVAVREEMASVAAALGGDTSCLSALHCWKVFAERLGCDAEDGDASEALLGDSLARLQQLAFDEAYFSYSPSTLAAAALYLGRKQRGILPFWPCVLQLLTGYHEDLHPQLSAALRELQHTSQHGSTISQAVFS